jgi:hypothetical protein
MTRARMVIVLVFLCGAAWFALGGARRPLIAIVHSYDESVPWARGTAAGLASVFDAANDVRVQRHYLDANGLGAVERQARLERVRDLIGSAAPQAVILMDDVAQTEVGAGLLGSYRGWIILGGIGAVAGKLPHAASGRIAGIGERTPWPAVEALALEFARQKGIANPRIALINDGGPAGDEEAAGFRAHGWTAMRIAGIWRSHDLAQWRAALPAVRAAADLVLVGDYGNMPLPENMSRQDGRRAIARMTLAALSVPLVSLSGYAVNDGFPVGVLPSPLEQGQEAARLGLAAMRGGLPGNRYKQSEQFLLVANDPVLASRALVLPELYASFARQVSPLIRPAGK